MRIGIDFDNTLICYEAVFTQLAVERALATRGERLSKQEVRSRARQSSGGELLWQRLQAEAYGPRIHEALPAPGVMDFLGACRIRNIPVCVISHKGEFAVQDPGGVNLRTAALEWLKDRGFFEPRVGLDPVDCHFSATRAGKLAQIAQEQCTHFIDDLPETFLDSSFPSRVIRLLYDAEGGLGTVLPEVRTFHTWIEIQSHLIG